MKPLTCETSSTEMAHIPAGKFQMGGKGRHAATPVHTVYLDGFWIDIYEVTNAQFKTFIDANPQWSKDNIPNEYHNGNYLKLWNGSDYPNGKANHPVVYVSWYAAMAYAQWVGKRLPTEAEWEKAARGGAVGKRYVWGDLPDPSKSNYIHNGNPEYTSPVGNFPPNGYGLYDMGGNVWELCLDEYDAKFYRGSADKNPIAGASDIKAIIENFTDVQTARVARGGSWVTPGPAHTADRGRDAPTNTNGWLGFRCAKSITVLEKDKSVMQNTDTGNKFTPQNTTKLLGTPVLLEMEYADEDITSVGSGFFVTPDKIATNIHVLAGAKKVTAKQVSTGKDYTVEGIIAFDDKNDLAVLKISEEETPFPFGNSDKVRIDDQVFALGYPKGEEREATGTIHGIRNSDKWFRVIIPSAGPGHSGSPVLNKKGEVVAVLNQLSYTEGSNTYDFGDAIPSNILEALINRIAYPVEPLSMWQRRSRVRAYAKFSQGNEVLRDGKPKNAIAAYSSAIKLNPDLVEVYSNRGMVKSGLGQYKKAIADYDAALRLKPDLALTYSNRAASKIALKDHEGAIKDCDTALRLNPDLVIAHCNRAVARVSLEDYESTLVDANFVIQLFPDSAEAFRLYTIRAAAKGVLGDTEGAIKDLDEVLTLKPDFAEAYALRSLAKIDSEAYQEAIENAEKAVQLNSTSEIAFASRSAAKRSLGKFNADHENKEEAQKWYHEAIEDARKAIKLKPKSNLPYNTLGRAKQCLGESNAEKGNLEEAKKLYNAAIADHTKSLRIKPKSSSAYNGRGWAKYLLGQLETEQGKTLKAHKYYQESVVDSDEAIRLAPKNSYYAYSYYHTRGAAKAALGDYKKAIEDFNEAIRIKSTHILSYRDRAKAKEALGATDAAKADLQKITQIHIDLAKNCFQEGQAKYQQHEYKAALACFDKALMLNPKYAGAYSNRGMAKSAIGRSESRKRNRSQAQHHFQEAIADYTEAITQNPKYASAYNNRGNAKYRLGLSESDSGNSEKAREHYQDAITDLDKAIQLNPKHVKAHNNRGKVKKALGQQAAAEADYKKAKALEAAD